MIRPYLLDRTKRPDRLAALAVTLAPLVYFQAAVRGRVFLAPFDGVLFNVPLRVAAANMLRDGHLPLWNPYVFCGMPLHASAQAGLLFPLNWFFYIFDARVATNLMAISAYMLAALGAYVLARRTGASVAGSLLTSVIYQSCGFLIGQISHINIVQTAAMLPWLLWALDRYGAEGDRKDGLIIAAIVALQAFTGHPQTLVYSLLLATAYAGVMWRASGKARNWYLKSLLLLAAGMVLAAVQILPTYELMRNSMRSDSSFNFFTSFSLPPSFLLTFFAPYVMGGGDGRMFRVAYFGPPFYGEFIGYIGLGALILVVIAIALKRDAETKFWAAVVVIGLALAIGGYWPFKLYGLIYYAPVLNLFRVPARHLIEVELALSLLAGRGLTALAATDRRRATRLALAVGAAIFLLTCLVVTVGRPAGFRLAREAPVTVLRAPELFLPVVIAALSAWVLWRYARRRSAGSLVLLVAIIVCDLCVWGQSSGWRVESPGPDDVIWREPPPLKRLPQANEPSRMPYRILTAPHPFDPNRRVVGPMTSRSTDWVFWLQPNIYMMQKVENAAGYDGFGLARYSRLAGDIRVWGEFPDPDRTLRGGGWDLDLLNVRYLLAMSPKLSGKSRSDERDATRPALGDTSAPMQVYGGQRFAEIDLGLSNLKAGERVSFNVPTVEADRISLLSNLSWAVEVPDGTKVGRVRVSASDGRSFEFDILAGRDTAEWAYDRDDIRARTRHRRANVATSYSVEDAGGRYEAHTYVTSFALPERASVADVEVEGVGSSRAPELLLSVLRISLSNSGSSSTTPVRRDWLAPARPNEEPSVPSGSNNARWGYVADADGVVIYENRRALPRAWLATEAQVLTDPQMLDVIHTGKFPEGRTWDPRRTVLIESPLAIAPAAPDNGSRAEIMKSEPNRVELKTASASPTILVLSANHYPGWRAYVDDRLVETLRVNYNLRGVALPAGNHEVSFVYFPKSVLIGLLISLFSATGLTLWYFRLLQEVRRLFPYRRGERV